MKSPTITSPPAPEAKDLRTPAEIAAAAESAQAFRNYLGRQERFRGNPMEAEQDFLQNFANIYQPGYEFQRNQAKGDEANISAELGWGTKRVGPQASRLSRRYGDIARTQGDNMAQQRYNHYATLRTAGIPDAPPVPGYTPQQYGPGQSVTSGGPSPFSQIFTPIMGALGTAAGGGAFKPGCWLAAALYGPMTQEHATLAAWINTQNTWRARVTRFVYWMLTPLFQGLLREANDAVER